MIDKFFSVSPSPKDIQGDLKSSEKLKPEEKDSYKKDFESYLNKNEPRGIKKKDSEKLAKKDKDSDDKVGEEKKTVKKKKIDINEEAALAIMASNENETEVPEIDKNLDFADSEYQNKNESISSAFFSDEKRQFNAIEEHAVLDLSGADQESEVSIDNVQQPTMQNEAVEEAIDHTQSDMSFENQVKMSLSHEARDLQFQDALKSSNQNSSAELDLDENKDTAQSTEAVKSFAHQQINDAKESHAEDESTFENNDSSQPDLQKSFHVVEAKSHGTDFSASMASGTQQAGDQPAVDKATQLESLKEVYNQAQYLVKKGGGEMSVQMTPEGMGTVHLKVALDNGQLQLEINTSDKSVKKLIEDHLSDLKSSLALQQMTVEHVKINTVAETNTENQARFDSKQNPGQNQNAFSGSFNSHQSAQDGRPQSDRQRRLASDSQSLTPQVSLNTVKRAAANRVYQSHKANSLNAVA